MSKFKGVRINEAEYDLENGEKGKIAVFIYSGSADPRKMLNFAIKNYVKGKDYYEFIDANLDNPWTKVILSNVNGMKQEKFSDYIFRENRKRKLEKLNG